MELYGEYFNNVNVDDDGDDYGDGDDDDDENDDYNNYDDDDDDGACTVWEEGGRRLGSCSKWLDLVGRPCWQFKVMVMMVMMVMMVTVVLLVVVMMVVMMMITVVMAIEMIGKSWTLLAIHGDHTISMMMMMTKLPF